MENELSKKIAAILFLYNDSITLSKIKEFLGDENINNEEIKNSIDILNNKLDEVGLTIIKNESRGEEKSEYTVSIKSDFSEIAKKIRQDELEGELTPASLQVITICAYLGACTKNEISFIRGVQSSQSIRSLSSRGLLQRNGEKYSLSTEAMQKLGINKIEDLPEYEKIKTDFSERLKEVLKDEKEESGKEIE